MEEITAIFGTIPDFIVDQWVKDMLDDQEWDQNTVLQVICDQTKNPLYPLRRASGWKVLLLGPDHDETDRVKRLKALFKETQALPQMQTIIEEEIAAEIDRYRSAQ